MFPSSPSWPRNTKLFALLWITIFLVASVVTFSELVLFGMVSVVVSLVIRPMVDWIDHRLPRIPRWLTTLFFFLLLSAGLLAIPISTLPSLIEQVAAFFNNLPELIQQLSDLIIVALNEPIVILGRYTLPTDQISNEDAQAFLLEGASILTSSVTSLGTIIGNLTSQTIGFVSRTVLVLFLSFYLTKDGHQLTEAVISTAPDNYQDDVRHLLGRLALIWGAFLRGQVILMLIIGTVTFVIASALGVSNPVVLGVIAGVMEIVPYFGPVLAAIPAVLLAAFQADASWLGSIVGPFWFTVIVLGAYWLIQQVENYIVLPRVMGHQLKLHPAIVFAAAIAGWQLAGIFGVFLASPAVATLRWFGTYLYCKLTDKTLTEMEEAIETAVEETMAVATEPDLNSEVAGELLPSFALSDTSDEETGQTL